MFKGDVYRVDEISHMHDDVDLLIHHQASLRKNSLHFHRLCVFKLNTLGIHCCQISKRLNSKLRGKICTSHVNMHKATAFFARKEDENDSLVGNWLWLVGDFSKRVNAMFLSSII